MFVVVVVVVVVFVIVVVAVDVDIISEDDNYSDTLLNYLRNTRRTAANHGVPKRRTQLNNIN